MEKVSLSINLHEFQHKKQEAGLSALLLAD